MILLLVIVSVLFFKGKTAKQGTKNQTAAATEVKAAAAAAAEVDAAAAAPTEMEPTVAPTEETAACMQQEMQR